MYLKWLLVLPMGLWGFSQTDSLSTLLQESGEGTLIVLDVDETLIRYPSHLGSTPWFEEAYTQLELDEFHRIAGLLAEHLAVVAVEPEAVEKVGKSPCVMGITRRTLIHPACPNWAEVTASQVEEAGYTFHPPANRGLHGGILITDGKEKGPALLEWLEREGIRPKGILFVDDRRSEVEEVEETLAPYCPIESVWYRPQRAHYDSEAAARELALLFRQVEDNLPAQDKDPR